MAKWRMLRLQANDAFINMALDEAISKSVAESKSVPTIRFYTWEPSAVSIGFFQGIHEEVNLNKCRELGVDVVRRRTGGGAVYHDSSGEITYSVIAPEKMMPKGITESYHLICGWIVKSLDLLGIKSEFKPINDIITDFKKISGNAQTRRDGILLQHGTILYDLDVEKMFSMLKVGQEKISDKMIADVKQRVTSVLQQKNIPIEELYDALVHGFGDGKDFDFAGLTEEEMIQASLLAESRYKTEEWNFMR
ncbi:lipoate--protein ligase family protein [Candidatus Woesearchaeota archaeon]|nr:lipoate--protein ligase family protein [Candidatus Woesearchaeota archaeon]